MGSRGHGLAGESVATRVPLASGLCAPSCDGIRRVRGVAGRCAPAPRVSDDSLVSGGCWYGSVKRARCGRGSARPVVATPLTQTSPRTSLGRGTAYELSSPSPTAAPELPRRLRTARRTGTRSRERLPTQLAAQECSGAARTDGEGAGMYSAPPCAAEASRWSAEARPHDACRRAARGTAVQRKPAARGKHRSYSCGDRFGPKIRERLIMAGRRGTCQ